MESGEEYDVDEEKNDDLIVKAYLYIISSTYPEGCPGSRKRVIWKKAKKLQVSEGELYYKMKQERYYIM